MNRAHSTCYRLFYLALMLSLCTFRQLSEGKLCISKDTIPKKSELQNLDIIEGIVDYSIVGTCLLKDDYGHKIKKLEQENPSITARVEEIYRLWTYGNGATPVSWATLVDCLRSAKLNRLIDEIELSYCAAGDDAHKNGEDSHSNNEGDTQTGFQSGILDPTFFIAIATIIVATATLVFATVIYKHQHRYFPSPPAPVNPSQDHVQVTGSTQCHIKGQNEEFTSHTSANSKDDKEATMLYRLLREGKCGLCIVMGRTGAGKSALVNSIVGEYVAEEGDLASGQTTEVTKHKKKKGDFTITIYDSPGLEDDIRIEDQRWKDVEEICKEVDLNIYCVKMNDRMRPTEEEAIMKFSNAFGKDELWKKTLFVLTFANEVKPPKQVRSPDDYFSKRVSAWKKFLQDALVDKAAIPKNVAENVLILPAGDSDEQTSSNCYNWLSKLWCQYLDPILSEINKEQDDLIATMIDHLQKKELCILLTGRTGAGKSALVNSIIGEYVAEESDSACEETTKVTRYEKNIGSITVSVYDSPGFQDGTTEIEEQYLNDLEKNCGEVDLYLYCVKMNGRMNPKSEAAILTKLSYTFGKKEFWQKTLFVLTFANEIKPPKKHRSTPVNHFSGKELERKKLLQDTLIEAGITKEVATNVPVVPVGSFDEPSLPAASCDYWLSKLWFQCLIRTKGADIKSDMLMQDLL